MSIADFALFAMTGVALSMDAATITAANMLTYGANSGRKKWLMPLFFALFQGIMPALGSLLGYLLADFISKYSGILLFIIFLALGIKMIVDGLKKGGDEGEVKSLSVSLIAIQALATSIDAFAVGVGFAAKGHSMLAYSTVIALTTLVICTIALLLGEQIAKKFGNKTAFIGGVILVGIAISQLF